MNALRFENPRFLVLLVILIPLLIEMALHYRKNRSLLNLFALPRAELRARYWISAGSFLLFAACVIIALAGPRWGIRLVPEFRRGADVVLAIDLSRSMEVRDVPPANRSRLEQGLGIARELAAASEGGRVAVAIGKGTGILAVPLTGDIEAVLSLLDSLSTEAVTGRGTNLENLIDAAAGAFQDAFPTKRRIVLFSDGEALQGNLGAAVDRAAAAEIAISAVGLGSETGGPAPSEEGQAPVISYRHRDSLQNAAERTGGIYLDGNSADAAALLADHGIAFAERGDTYRREPKSQRRLFLLAALAALGLSRLPGKRWRAHEKG